MNKYIFIYELDNGKNVDYDFFDAEDDEELNDRISEFVNKRPTLNKLIIVDIKHTHKIPIDVYKKISP